jgi:hypothetical protein
MDPMMSMLWIWKSNYAAEMMQHEKSLWLPV